MRTKTLLFTLLLFSAMVSAQVKRVAILETVDRENKVSYANLARELEQSHYTYLWL